MPLKLKANCVYTTRIISKKGKRKPFSLSFYFIFSWNIHKLHVPFILPCSDGMRRSFSVKEANSVLGSSSLFSGRQTYSFFPPSIKEEHFSLIVRIVERRRVHIVCTFYNQQNSQQKTFSNSRARFRNYFSRVFVFPSFPFSRLRSFHWLRQLGYLLLESSSFILSLFLPLHILVVVKTTTSLWCDSV